MIIMKFGGTSVGSPENIQKVIKIIQSNRQTGGIVVSAFTKVTDQLIQLSTLASHGNKSYKNLYQELFDRHKTAINKLISDKNNQKNALLFVQKTFHELEQILTGVYLIKELSPKTLDLILSFGERLSAYIIAESLKDFGIQAIFVDARKLVKTNNLFGSAKVDFVKTNKNIQKYFKSNSNNLKIITGFIASTDHDETTTLGRGGSDYTASIFGAAINAASIEIWTDVDGVMDADPRIVADTNPIHKMTYEEAMEMSHFGAKVICPSTMRPAMEKQIPIIIKNTFNPDFPGTIIGKATSNNHPVKGISSISDTVMIRLQGSGVIGAPAVVGRLFSTLAKKNINVILITQASSEYNICFAIDPKKSDITIQALNEEFRYEIRDKSIDEVIAEKNLSIITAVGEYMHHTPGIAGQLFNALGTAKVNIIAIAQGSSERNISLVINKKNEAKALNVIHQAFFKI